MKKIIINIVLILSFFAVNAQDYEFSQKYSQLQIFSPSLCGLNKGLTLSSTYRTSPTLSYVFLTYSISVESNIEKYNSGLGIYMINDQTMSNLINFKEFVLTYNYNFKVFEKLNVRPGLKFKYATKKLNYDKLVFNDQLNFNDLDIPTNEVFDGKQRKNYVDFDASILLYNNKFWLGYNLEHITRPNNSYSTEFYRIPLKHIIYGGIKFDFNQDKTNKIVITSYLNIQNYNSFLAFNALLVFKNFNAGLGWKELSLLNTYATNNVDILTVFLGYKYKIYTLSYSYDFSYVGIFNTNELTLSINLLNKNKENSFIF